MRTVSKAATFAAIPFFCSTLLSSDISVLIDVSGTMRNYGPWQADANKLIESLLIGGQPDMNVWKVSGELNKGAEFRLQSGQNVHLLRFGQIRSPEFPFFLPPRTISDLSAFRAEFPNDPSLYTEARTNKALAQAVGTKLAEAGGIQTRLIVISDFLVDSNLNAAQLDFVNSLESRTKSEPPLIFSWKSNANVQVKLIRVSVLGEVGTTPDPGADISIRLLAARVLEGSPRRVQFQWRMEGEAQPRYFDLTVRDSSRKVDWISRNLIGSSAVWNGANSGKKTWQVRAVLEDGREIMSPARPFEIPGPGIAPILLTLAGLAALGGGIYYFAGRRRNSKRTGTQTA